MGTKFKTMKDLAERIEKERPDILESMEDTELEHLVARQIREFRKKANISQRIFTEKAELTQCQISRIENGAIGSFGSLKKVLDALDLEIKLVPKKKIHCHRVKRVAKANKERVVAHKSTSE
ncbi:MAG: helix-turn-helix transcriptional regulator [Clostridiaceae bacterium]|nr:helix-turn-helix transcriptional regulator [Clostridiaceae bacterium]